MLIEDHLACSPCNPKFPECHAVHPDGVVIIGNQERRTSARETSQVLSGTQRPTRKSGIIPTFYLDPLQLRTLHSKFPYLRLDLRYGVSILNADHIWVSTQQYVDRTV